MLRQTLCRGWSAGKPHNVLPVSFPPLCHRAQRDCGPWNPSRLRGNEGSPTYRSWAWSRAFSRGGGSCSTRCGSGGGSTRSRTSSTSSGGRSCDYGPSRPGCGAAVNVSKAGASGAFGLGAYAALPSPGIYQCGLVRFGTHRLEGERNSFQLWPQSHGTAGTQDSKVPVPLGPLAWRFAFSTSTDASSAACTVLIYAQYTDDPDERHCSARGERNYHLHARHRVPDCHRELLRQDGRGTWGRGDVHDRATIRHETSPRHIAGTERGLCCSQALRPKTAQEDFHDDNLHQRTREDAEGGDLWPAKYCSLECIVCCVPLHVDRFESDKQAKLGPLPRLHQRASSRVWSDELAPPLPNGCPLPNGAHCPYEEPRYVTTQQGSDGRHPCSFPHGPRQAMGLRLEDDHQRRIFPRLVDKAVRAPCSPYGHSHCKLVHVHRRRCTSGQHWSESFWHWDQIQEAYTRRLGRRRCFLGSRSIWHLRPTCQEAEDRTAGRGRQPEGLEWTLHVQPQRDPAMRCIPTRFVHGALERQLLRQRPRQAAPMQQVPEDWSWSECMLTIIQRTGERQEMWQWPMAKEALTGYFHEQGCCEDAEIFQYHDQTNLTDNFFIYAVDFKLIPEGVFYFLHDTLITCQSGYECQYPEFIEFITFMHDKLYTCQCGYGHNTIYEFMYFCSCSSSCRGSSSQPYSTSEYWFSWVCGLVIFLFMCEHTQIAPPDFRWSNPTGSQPTCAKSGLASRNMDCTRGRAIQLRGRYIISHVGKKDIFGLLPVRYALPHGGHVLRLGSRHEQDKVYDMAEIYGCRRNLWDKRVACEGQGAHQNGHVGGMSVRTHGFYATIGGYAISSGYTTACIIGETNASRTSRLQGNPQARRHHCEQDGSVLLWSTRCDIDDYCVICTTGRPCGRTEMFSSSHELDSKWRPTSLLAASSAFSSSWLDLHREAAVGQHFTSKSHQRVACGNGGVADESSFDFLVTEAEAKPESSDQRHCLLSMWKQTRLGCIHWRSRSLDLQHYFYLHQVAPPPNELSCGWICRWPSSSSCDDEQASTPWLDWPSACWKDTVTHEQRPSHGPECLVLHWSPNVEAPRPSLHHEVCGMLREDSDGAGRYSAETAVDFMPHQHPSIRPLEKGLARPRLGCRGVATCGCTWRPRRIRGNMRHLPRLRPLGRCSRSRSRNSHDFSRLQKLPRRRGTPRSLRGDGQVASSWVLRGIRRYCRGRIICWGRRRVQQNRCDRKDQRRKDEAAPRHRFKSLWRVTCLPQGPKSNAPSGVGRRHGRLGPSGRKSATRDRVLHRGFRRRFLSSTASARRAKVLRGLFPRQNLCGYTDHTRVETGASHLGAPCCAAHAPCLRHAKYQGRQAEYIRRRPYSLHHWRPAATRSQYGHVAIPVGHAQLASVSEKGCPWKGSHVDLGHFFLTSKQRLRRTQGRVTSRHFGARLHLHPVKRNEHQRSPLLDWQTGSDDNPDTSREAVHYGPPRRPCHQQFHRCTSKLCLDATNQTRAALAAGTASAGHQCVRTAARSNQRVYPGRVSRPRPSNRDSDGCISLGRWCCFDKTGTPRVLAGLPHLRAGGRTAETRDRLSRFPAGGRSSRGTSLSTSLVKRVGCIGNQHSLEKRLHICPDSCHAVKNQWQGLRSYRSRTRANLGGGELLPRGRRAHPWTRERSCGHAQQTSPAWQSVQVARAAEGCARITLASSRRNVLPHPCFPARNSSGGNGGGQSSKLDYSCYISRAQSQTAEIEGSPATNTRKLINPLKPRLSNVFVNLCGGKRAYPFGQPRAVSASELFAPRNPPAPAVSKSRPPAATQRPCAKPFTPPRPAFSATASRSLAGGASSSAVHASRPATSSTPSVAQPAQAVTNPRRLCAHPKVSVRGTMPSTALSSEDAAQQLEDLQRDFFAPGSFASRQSHPRSWTFFHQRWFGEQVPVFPLTDASIQAVSAQMKACGYRSFPNYMDTVMSTHSESHDWHRALELIRKRAVTSCLRGIGPAKQCAEIPIEPIWQLDISNDPLAEDGPVCPRQWAIVCSYHMTRGAESACALAWNLVVDLHSKQEHWKLPISKCDPTAIGCIRTWGCLCDEHNELPCPYHAACQIKQELLLRFGVNGQLPNDLPLFPNAQGDWCSRNGFVRTVESLATKLSLPLLDTLGRRAYGEHVFRVSGARHMASLEMPVSVIMKLARWGSSIVLRYLGDAPLQTLTSTYLRHRQMVTSRLQSAIPAILEQSTQPSSDLLEDAAEDSPYVYLQHLSTKRIHLVLAADLEFDRCQHLVTLCAWTANLSTTALFDSCPPGTMCKDCTKAAARQAS